jgi:hypothetical protein
MAEFDPVPPQYLLPEEVAQQFIPVEFMTGGDATPRELALHVLVDDDPDRQHDIKIFQQGGRGEVTEFFGFMFRTMASGAGRHTQRMIAVACLHPVRDTRLNLVVATEEYLKVHGSKQDDYLMAGVLLGSLSSDAWMESDENEARVARGELYREPSPLND